MQGTLTARYGSDSNIWIATMFLMILKTGFGNESTEAPHVNKAQEKAAKEHDESDASKGFFHSSP